MNPDRSREEMTAEANEIRADLVETVEKLDRIRRHPPLALAGTHARALVRWSAVGGVALAAVGSLVVVVFERRERSLERVRRDRMRLLREAWARPARLLGARERPFVVRALQSLALTLLGSIFHTLSARTLLRLTAAAPRAAEPRRKARSNDGNGN
jgi:hypothetical protein